MDRPRKARGVTMAPAAEVEAEWMAIALELDADNRELRRLLTSILLCVARREDLIAYARAEINRRWPEQRAA